MISALGDGGRRISELESKFKDSLDYTRPSQKKRESKQKKTPKYKSRFT